jgi:hypothetical protein
MSDHDRRPTYGVGVAVIGARDASEKRKIRQAISDEVAQATREGCDTESREMRERMDAAHDRVLREIDGDKDDGEDDD